MTPFDRMRQELLGWSEQSGMSPSVLLRLEEPLRSTLKRIMRVGSVTFEELATHLGLTMPETETIADLLVACGFLKTVEEGKDGAVVYSIRHTRNHRPGAPLGVWNALLGSDEPGGDDGG
jgi:hypothetical protein